MKWRTGEGRESRLRILIKTGRKPVIKLSVESKDGHYLCRVSLHYYVSLFVFCAPFFHVRRTTWHLSCLQQIFHVQRLRTDRLLLDFLIVFTMRDDNKVFISWWRCFLSWINFIFSAVFSHRDILSPKWLQQCLNCFKTDMTRGPIYWHHLSRNSLVSEATTVLVSSKMVSFIFGCN